MPDSIKKNKEAMAETIENNLRRVIIEDSPTNPVYYEKMSVLLSELIRLRKEETLEYEKYLKEIIALSAKIKKPASTGAYPVSLDTPAKQNLYDNLGKNEVLTVDMDQKIRITKRDGWRDHKIKLKEVKYAIQEILDKHEVSEPDAESLLNLVKNQKEY